MDPRRALPSVDALLGDPALGPAVEAHGREAVKQSVRRVLEGLRKDPAALEGDADEALRGLILADVERAAAPSLRAIVNGTGVVLHTNLGRAPLAEEAIAAAARAAGYGNVEYALETGERGSRYDHCVGLLRELAGTDAALVTNNNAAAVSLCVNELSAGRETIVSRGELVEIGGSFRIPDVVARSGAILREVGTTNRTRLTDYSAAVGADTGVLLRVHPSNYRVEGFADRPTIDELVELSRDTGLPLVHDIGSGLLRTDLLPGFPPEPTVAESVSAGADLVTLSGDKLLGGPQAGLIVGRADLIARLRRNPLLRAFRVDKTTLAALEATLLLHRDPEVASRRIPTLRMLRETAESVERRARAGLEEALAGAPPPAGLSIARTEAVVGGGSFPGFALPSAGWVVAAGRAGGSPDALAAVCRGLRPPLIGRIHDGDFTVDVRTVPEGHEAAAAALLLEAVGKSGDGGS
ncbi:MAG: L-seryl-tRNA(Sec) selenium transferase [Gemmatimonadota bacterium]|nr:L-seryl-tRNA(Sec) selenium transferase [Gemmatimonadota bacterium]